MADEKQVSVPEKIVEAAKEQEVSAKQVQDRLNALLKHLAEHGIHFNG